MTDRTEDLRNRRDTVLAKARTIAEKARDEGRELTGSESAELNASCVCVGCAACADRAADLLAPSPELPQPGGGTHPGVHGEAGVRRRSRRHREPATSSRHGELGSRSLSAERQHEFGRRSLPRNSCTPFRVAVESQVLTSDGTGENITGVLNDERHHQPIVRSRCVDQREKGDHDA